MRIAQVAPLYESVPPQLYGGTERVVSYLTEELVIQGHEVWLFASGDSDTKAHLVPCSPRSLRLDEDSIDKLAHHILMIEKVFQLADSVDFIHFHIDYLHIPVSSRYDFPNVTTLHGRLDIPDLVPLYKEFSDMPVISISKDQRKPLPWLNWQGTVYHGLPEDLHILHPIPGKYLAFLGRISPEKGLDRAIEIAKRAGMALKVAAKIDAADRDYFAEVIKPMLDDPLVEYIGEIGEDAKEEFLGNAYALLFPIRWPEPFGLTMIESMSCGTPIVAFREGSVPEVIDVGKSGFIVQSVDEAVDALKRIEGISRKTVRETFEQRFSARRMAQDDLEIYRKILYSDVPSLEAENDWRPTSVPAYLGAPGYSELF